VAVGQGFYRNPRLTAGRHHPQALFHLYEALEGKGGGIALPQMTATKKATLSSSLF
jgi:hypothetical protein